MLSVVIDYTQDLKSGYWTATAPAYPQVVTQGRTFAQTILNVRDALSLVLPELPAEELNLIDGQISAASA